MTQDDDVKSSSASQDAEAPDVAEPQKAGARRVGRHLTRAAALLVLTPLAIGMIALLLLLDRDIPAPSWIVAEIEERAGEVLAGGRLDVREMTVNFGRDLHPRVRLRDTILRDAAGSQIARVPVIESLFSPRGLLFERAALMQDLRVQGAQINLRRAADGSVALSFQSGATEVEEAQDFLALLDQSDQIFERPAFAALETIRADGLIINYQDSRAGRAWTVDGGALTLDVRNEKTALMGNFAVLSGGSGITTLTMDYTSPRNSPAAQFAIEIKDAEASDIAAQSPALSWLAGVSGSVSAKLESARNPDGTLAPVAGSVTLGPGALQPNAATNPIPFDGGNVDLVFDPISNVIRFREVAIAGELGQVQAEGEAFLTDMINGFPRALTGQLRFADTVLNPPDLFSEPIDIPQMQVDMRLNLRNFVLDVGQIYAQLPGVVLRGSGQLAATDMGWDSRVDMSLDEFAFSDALALWPKIQLPGTRSWFSGAVQRAQIEDLTLGLRKTGNAPMRVAGSFGFSDLSLTYLGSLPPIEAGRGTGVFTSERFGLMLNSGEVTAPTGDVLNMAGSTMTIPDLAAQYRPAEYDLRMTGEIPGVLAILDLPPMGYMQAASLPLDVAQGTAVVDMYLSHPLKSGMTGADVGFSASATLRDVRSDGLIPERNLRATTLQLQVDKAGLQISGSARVDDVPLTGTWTQTFSEPGGAVLEADVELTAAGMARFGVELPPGTISGRGRADLSLRFPRNDVPRYQISSDLRGLEVAIPAVGWAKPPSVAGRLGLSGRLGPDPQVDDLAISGGGLDVRGNVTFTADGGLDRARLARVQIGNWLNAPITLRGRGPGRPLAVNIQGGVIDLRRARFGSGGGESGPISIALDRLQVTEGIALNRFSGEFSSNGGFAGRFGAWINNVGQIQGTVAPRNGRSAVRIISRAPPSTARHGCGTGPS